MLYWSSVGCDPMGMILELRKEGRQLWYMRDLGASSQLYVRDDQKSFRGWHNSFIPEGLSTVLETTD